MSDLSEVREMYLAEVRRAEKAEAELAALKDADARKTVAMIDYVVAMGPCDENNEDEEENGTCLSLTCHYCDLVRVANDISDREELSASKLLEAADD